jgi:hypothetical protein
MDGMERRLSDLSKLTYKLAILCIAETVTDPKRLRKKLPNEGHGFSRAVNSLRLTASAGVRFPAIFTAAGQQQQPDFIRQHSPQNNQPVTSQKQQVVSLIWIGLICNSSSGRPRLSSYDTVL